MTNSLTIKYYLLAFLFFTAAQLRGQSWRVEEVGNLPDALTNTATAEGFNRDTAFIYAFGGLDSTKNYAGIHRRSYRFNPVSRLVQRLPDLPDSLGKIAASASRVKNKLYILGGYHVFANGNEKSSNRVHRFDPASNTFLTDGSPIPLAIDDHVQAVWRDSLIYVITGWSNTANVPNVQIYNALADVWQVGTAVPNNNVFKSFGASGVILGDTIFYFGGASMGSSFPAQSVLRKGVINPQNPTDITWSSVVFAPAYRAAVTVVDKTLCIIGGSATTYNYDGIAYNGSGGVVPIGKITAFNTTTNRTTEQIIPILPMDLRTIATVNDSVRYLIGGMETGQKVSKKILKLTYQSTTTSTNRTPQYKLQKTVKLYPNPVSDTLFIEKDERGIGDFELRLFAADGRLVALYKNPEKLAVNGFSKGIYFAEFIENNTVIFTSQIVIK
jgi:hypothetical protein